MTLDVSLLADLIASMITSANVDSLILEYILRGVALLVSLHAAGGCEGAIIGIDSGIFAQCNAPQATRDLKTRVCSVREWNGVARSTVDTQRVRVHNKASVGATVARRADRPVPYLCMRIDVARLFGAEIVLDNRHLGIGGHMNFSLRTETSKGTSGGAGSAELMDIKSHSDWGDPYS
ncbi:hypothetical protein EVAR_68534_1 [Eumeta japonica]|uniref:Uncharacterized protein n=1 Tax=Eumeta variegata TaxID=151549 RepID=A0A4C1SPR4_EUMVA|nr:hypothetical protein EVAR_68534_1 [Eumeta japonica]